MSDQTTPADRDVAGFTRPLSVVETAAVCGVTPSAVRSWRSRGIGPRSYRIGSRVLFDRADVHDWIEAQKTATSVGGIHPAA